MKEEDEGRIVVQRNLFDALKLLKDNETSRLFWIDAISINQEDLEERTQEVRYMGDIYKFAQRVVVWLGSASPGFRYAMQLLGHIGDQVEFSGNN